MPGSSNLKEQYKVLCSGNERKICYILLNNLGLIILGNQVYLAVSKGCLLSFIDLMILELVDLNS